MKCDLCGREGELRVVEHDKVLDKRRKSRYHYNAMHICDKCYREWQVRLCAEIAGKAIAAWPRGE